MKAIKQIKDKLDFADPNKWSVQEWNFWLDYGLNKKQVNESDLKEAVLLINHRLELLTQQLLTLLSIDPIAREDAGSVAFARSIALELKNLDALEKQTSTCAESNFKRTVLKVTDEFKPLWAKIGELEEFATKEPVKEAPKPVIKEQPKQATKEVAKPSRPVKGKARKS